MPTETKLGVVWAMTLPAFDFEELTLHQTASLNALYRLYCRNFPLPDEQESLENFRRCLELNDDEAVQRRYGPYHEYYLALRRWNAKQGKYDEIAGGLIFGVTTSPEHWRHGFLCSVQAIYLFRETDEPVKRFLVTRRAWLEEAIAGFARKACQLPRFRQAAPDPAASRIAMFFEVNNPRRMSPEETQTDRDLSHLHPALRYKMWLNHRTGPLAFRYVQPPLSPNQQAVTFLDLFAVESRDGAEKSEQRLSAGENGDAGVPGPLLAAHLRAFFSISVLKGDADAIDRPCIPFRDGANATETLQRLDDYCSGIASRAFIPLLRRDDPLFRDVRNEAWEASLTSVVQESTRRTRNGALDFRDLSLLQLDHYIILFRRYGERASIALFMLISAFLILRYFGMDIDGRDNMTSAGGWLEVALVASFFALLLISWIKRRKRDRRDRSFAELRASLKALMEQGAPYEGANPSVVLRDVLSDRAANNFTYGILIPSQRDRQPRDLQALGRFLASRTLSPRLAEIGLGQIDTQARLEAKRIEEALTLFRLGALQAQYDATPWTAYYSCVFPVDVALTTGADPYDALEDFDRFVDQDVADAMLHDPLRRAEFFENRQCRPNNPGVCLFVSHILDLPWDDADPLPDLSVLSFRPQSQSRNTEIQKRVASYWRADAEAACGRMLTVISHLAVVMGRMSRNRQVSTDLFCDCTVLIHLTSKFAINFMAQLGFEQVRRPAVRDGEHEDRPGALGGTLLTLTLKPGAESFARQKPASAAFFGLINAVAKGQKEWAA